jgi:hypothetical protein
MCITPTFAGSQYYIFSNTDLTYLTATPSPPQYLGWQYYAGPFDLTTLTKADTNIGTYPGSAFLTEFDVAQRADGSLVAVVTPAVMNGSVQQQGGCIAADFSLLNAAPPNSQPFVPQGAVVVLTDSYADQTGNENYGPNACTYEPTSRTGMLIVRRLHGQNSFVWSLIQSGLMP